MATAGAVRKRMSGAQRSVQLLDVAEELFMAKGFDQTTLEDVAKTAGVSRPIVYEHHGSKEGVYLACLARARHQLIRDYEEALTGLEDPLELLRAAAKVWFSLVERDPSRWLLLFGTGIPLSADLERTAARTRSANSMFYREAITRFLRDDVSPGHAAAAAQMITGTGSQLARWWLENREISKADIVSYYTDFCWSGLRPLLAEGFERG